MGKRRRSFNVAFSDLFYFCQKSIGLSSLQKVMCTVHVPTPTEYETTRWAISRRQTQFLQTAFVSSTRRHFRENKNLGRRRLRPGVACMSFQPNFKFIQAANEVLFYSFVFLKRLQLYRIRFSYTYLFIRWYGMWKNGRPSHLSMTLIVDSPRACVVYYEI